MASFSERTAAQKQRQCLKSHHYGVPTSLVRPSGWDARSTRHGDRHWRSLETCRHVVARRGNGTSGSDVIHHHTPPFDGHFSGGSSDGPRSSNNAPHAPHRGAETRSNRRRPGRGSRTEGEISRGAARSVGLRFSGRGSSAEVHSGEVRPAVVAVAMAGMRGLMPWG